MLIPRIVARTAALVAVAVVGVSGCSRGSDTPSSVNAAELQKAIIAKLAEAGTPSAWVNCPKNLPGKVGATSRCDVKFSSDSSVTALLTTTQVSGDKVSWEITGPELTKDQVARRIAGLTSAESATCETGLEGRTGNFVVCQITKNGATLDQAVEVKGVKGLSVDLSLTPLVSKQQLEEAVLDRSTPMYGRRPDTAECRGGLEGVVGQTIGCVVTVGGNPASWVVTVTGVSGGSIYFDVARTAGGKPAAVDMCHGCPG